MDAQGHVNNANYLSFFEVGRVEWLRDAGLSYRDLERRGFGFVVVEALVHYHSAAYFDDELVVRTELAEAGRVALRFGYEVLRADERVASGHTRHACVRLPGGRPVRMPEEVRALANELA
ncbi:MAG: acyl-CoA thioesterase [Actinomycetota bacterium]|nr:acyl-CoA thioesterase [Actinomycetota bacterium]